jgi:hypothetical protein
MSEHPKSIWSKLIVLTTFITALTALLGILSETGLDFFPANMGWQRHQQEQDLEEEEPINPQEGYWHGRVV